MAATTAAASVLPHSNGEPFGCSTPAMSDSQRAAAKAMSRQEMQMHEHERVSVEAINVDTYIHVVAANKTVEGGYVNRATLLKQMEVLNDNFRPSGISFTLVDMDWTINSAWAASRNELGMKSQLRKGNYSALNLYYLLDLGGSLGICYYPTNTTSGFAAFVRDGCSVLHTSVPGGSAVNYNEGKTTTHEIGHWFGLVHTFGESGNGCYGDGDYVGDTPAQKERSRGCPTGIDTCPTLPGLDPIHNYMDYSYDSCYEEFTAGQMDRMRSMWNRYRKGN